MYARTGKLAKVPIRSGNIPIPSLLGPVLSALKPYVIVRIQAASAGRDNVRVHGDDETSIPDGLYRPGVHGAIWAAARGGMDGVFAQLVDLATDLRWTWSHAGDAVWESIDSVSWKLTRNPYAVLQNLSAQRLEELSSDTKFQSDLASLADSREQYLSRACWGDEVCAAARGKHIAYFSMEFGLGEALPLYAGGLGILAGDYLKSASDLGLPIFGVGLLYQEGYFRQMLDADWQQQEIYTNNDSRNLPIAPVRTEGGAWLTVSIHFPGRLVRFRVWQARVGRVSLYLLDSNDPLNSPSDQGITSQLYGGSKEMRLVQEIALGIGGWRLIKALQLPVAVCHLNEGHAAFVTVERARCLHQETGQDFWEAMWATRAGNVFTTHTPVAAAFDTFPPDLMVKYGIEFAQNLDIEAADLMGLGRKNPKDLHEPFNMTYLASRTCARINAVSRLHGDVSRRIFSALYPRWPIDEIPVTHITNGVHVPSWDSRWADKIWTAACGKDRWLGSVRDLHSAIEPLSDEELWNLRGEERADLVNYARTRLARQLGQRGEEPGLIRHAGSILDPNVLTLGFARRFTEYKRPNLLLRDPERLARLLTHAERPVQIIVAGKAHPKDHVGKGFLRDWVLFAQRPDVRAHAVFLEDYDMALAQEMVQGVDVWINTPRRPWEACGTSGMKVLVNGGINLSSLDGWWAEAYTPEVGWALGDDGELQSDEWDAQEAEQLYALLEQEVVPEFYDRNSYGIPESWVRRIRTSMATLAPRFSSNRMLREYTTQIYLPAAADFEKRTADGGMCARRLRDWKAWLNDHWPNVHWGNLEVYRDGDASCYEVQVYLGDIQPECIQVHLYAEGRGEEEAVRAPMDRGAAIPGSSNGFVYVATLHTGRPVGDFTPRVTAYHPDAQLPAEASMISWWSGERSVHESQSAVATLPAEQV